MDKISESHALREALKTSESHHMPSGITCPLLSHGLCKRLGNLLDLRYSRKGGGGGYQKRKSAQIRETRVRERETETERGMQREGGNNCSLSLEQSVREFWRELREIATC